jgi:hypothetical protein
MLLAGRPLKPAVMLQARPGARPRARLNTIRVSAAGSPILGWGSSDLRLLPPPPPPLTPPRGLPFVYAVLLPCFPATLFVYIPSRLSRLLFPLFFPFSFSHPPDLPPPCNIHTSPLPQAAADEGSSSPDSLPASMSLDAARTLLGVGEGASFDEIVASKNRLLKSVDGDMDRQIEVETAYDILLMQSMKRRLTGEVPTAVRFADVNKNPPRPAASRGASSSRGGGSGGGQVLLPNLPGGALQLRPSQGKDLTTQSGVFALLTFWTLVQGISLGGEGGVPGGVPAGGGVPSFQLALALAASVYFLKEKKRASLGKAIGVAVVR